MDTKDTDTLQAEREIADAWADAYRTWLDEGGIDELAAYFGDVADAAGVGTP